MSSDNIITQCPGCKTQFRVTPGQLKVANGQVRCGACLEVFPAVPYNHYDEPCDTLETIDKQSLEKPNSTALEKAPDNVTHSKNRQPISAKPDATLSNAMPEKAPADQASESESQHNIPLDIKTAPEASNVTPTLTIQREAVVLTKPEQTKEKNAFLWFCILCIASLVLLTQYAWFNRAELYWNEQYQPIYNILCSHTDCQINHRSDLEQITNQQLIVKPHKRFEDAITAHIILLNSASFEQPYPALSLSFSDLKGRPIANRIFQPGTYLNTINKVELMPINQPVQLSLEFMSPGSRAVSYTLELLAPES